MNAELKTKWLEALRSGQYAQGQGALRDQHDNYCCLGVLCGLSELAAWERHTYTKLYNYLNFSCEFPSAVKALAEINDDNINTLITMNDGDGASFSDIANWIEANL